MTPENWINLIIGLVIFNYLFSTVLDYINGKNWKTEIPPVMKDFYDEDKYLKAKNYSKEKRKGKFNFKYIEYFNNSIIFNF